MAREQLLRDFRDAMHSQRYSAIILDNDDPLTWEDSVMARHYERYQIAVADSSAFWPISGYPTRPQWIYIPKMNANIR